MALVGAGVAFFVATAEADLEIEHGMVILLVVFVILPLVAIWLAIKAWRMADRPGGALVAGLIVIAAFLPAPIAFAVVVYEPAGPPEGVAIGDFTGPWIVSGTETEIYYKDDGTYTMSSISRFSETVFEQGGYEVAGNILTHISSEASNTCAEGQTGRYEIEILNNHKWRLHLLDDECTPRSEGSPFTLGDGP